MNLEAQSHFKEANDLMEKISRSEKNLLNTQEKLDEAHLNLDSIKAHFVSQYKDKGLAISIIKDLLFQEDKVISAKQSVDTLSRAAKGTQAVIKFFYSKIDLEKKAMAQIQAETGRGLNDS